MITVISIPPVAFLNIRWYGIMVALAVLAIVLWMLWQVRKGAKLSSDTVLMAAVVGIPSGVVISRLLHVIDNIVVAKLHPELVLEGKVIDYTQHLGSIVGSSGLTIYGAVLGAALGIWIYSKFSNFQFGYFMDLVAPGVILAQAIGRVGCTINGCCHGIEAPSWLFWAIQYDSEYPYAVSAGYLDKPLYPAQPYEIIFLLLVFAVLVVLRGRFRPEGSLFLIYLSLYSLWRVGIDFLRVGAPVLFGLHPAQLIAIIVLAITIPLLALRTRWVKAES